MSSRENIGDSNKKKSRKYIQQYDKDNFSSTTQASKIIIIYKNRLAYDYNHLFYFSI